MSKQRNSIPMSIALPFPASPLTRQYGVSIDGQAISPVSLSRSTSAMSEEDITDKNVENTLKLYKITLKEQYKRLRDEREALLVKVLCKENTPSEHH